MEEAHALEKNFEQQVLNGKTTTSYALVSTMYASWVSGIIQQYLGKNLQISLYLDLKTKKINNMYVFKSNFDIWKCDSFHQSISHFWSVCSFIIAMIWTLLKIAKQICTLNCSYVQKGYLEL